VQPIKFKNLECDICEGHPEQCDNCPLGLKLSTSIAELNEILHKHAYEVELIKHLFLEIENEHN
jgi:hypothetical protein